MSLLIVGSAVSPVASAPGRAHAAAYYLLGDASNTGASATQFTSTSAGDAWSFTASGSSATTLVGNCPNGSACWGVQGKGTGIGVYGSANGATATSSAGVQGTGGSTAANGQSYGGYFTATNNASGGKATGVYGSGATAGVYATSASNAVRAVSTGASGNGVYATGSGSSFYGVWGDVGGGGYGVVGSSSEGTGVYGSSTGSTGNTADVAGVYGYNTLSAVGNTSKINSAVFGNCPNCNGVSGTSANFVGVRGTATGTGKTTYGGFFAAASGTGLYAGTTKGSTALRAVNPNKTSNHYAAVFDGNVRINGNYVATGTKSAVVPTTEGDRLMYAEEATENYFSDQGSATLRHGRAVVKIDPLFAQVADLSVPYMVIVTPLSFDTAGLGAGNLTARSFEVRELNGGTGTFTFSWRITALRKGYADARMAAAPADVASPAGLSLGGAPTSAGPPAVKAPPAPYRPSGPQTK